VHSQIKSSCVSTFIVENFSILQARYPESSFDETLCHLNFRNNTYPTRRGSAAMFVQLLHAVACQVGSALKLVLLNT
jgi:hypothetical protein